MKAVDELEVMRLIDEKLCQIEDCATKNRILRWAWEKHSSEASPEKTEKTRKKSKKKKRSKAKSKAKRPSIVKDLNLHPKGKPSFEEFFQKKEPSVGDRTYAVCVYYLEKILGVKRLSQNHIYTCMKKVKRKPPRNLDNALMVSASRYGNIDTHDLANITITVGGENLVEHELARENGAE